MGMNITSHFITSAILLSCLSGLTSRAEIPTDSASVGFRQSRTELLMNFGNNAEELSGFNLRVAQRDSLTPKMRLQEVRIIGGASPEGSLQFNRWLSQKRAERIASYLLPRLDADSSMISHQFLGRDWRGVLSLVQADPKVPYKEEVTALLQQIIAENDSLGTEQESTRALSRLKHLRNCEPYIYLYHNIFPAVRASKLVAVYARPFIGAPMAPGLARVETPLNLTPLPVAAEVPAPRRPFYMAIYTNMLLDAALIPNLGADFYLGKHFSINASWMYSWWKTDRHHRYWRTYGGYLEPRWWFGSQKPLTGHHIGLYGQMATYDFELGGRGYLGPRWSWGAGVSYGYSLPVAKRLNIDFTLGVGYFGGKYHEYLPIDNCYVWQVTKHRHWFGPTKAEISLVWLIGRGNYNKKFARK